MNQVFDRVTYNKARNKVEVIVITAELAGFIFIFFDTDSRVCQKALRFIYQQWFLDSGYCHDGDFKYETYCENSGTYSEDFYISIKRRENNDKTKKLYLE